MNKCQLNQRNLGNFVSSAGRKRRNRPMTRFDVYIERGKKAHSVYAYSVYVHI